MTVITELQLPSLLRTSIYEGITVLTMAEDYSITTGKIKVLSTADYVLFGLTLAVSAGIGFFYAFKDRNKLNSKDFLLGGRQMYVFPVAMSLMVTFMSALTLLGTPAEMYNFTTMFWWLCLSFVLAIGLSVRIFIPFFYNLHITSIFQVSLNIKQLKICKVGLFKCLKKSNSTYLTFM